MNEKKPLPKPDDLAKAVIGYILRIIPLLEIAGYFLVGITWYKLSKVYRNTILYLAFIMAIVGGIAALYDAYNQVYSTINPPISSVQALNPIELYNKTLEGTKIGFTPVNIGVRMLIPSIVLLVEAIAFTYLHKIESSFKLYLPILFILLAIVTISLIPATYITIGNMEKTLDELQELEKEGTKLTIEEVSMKLLQDTLPTVTTSITLLILKIVVFILATLAFNRFKNAVKKEIYLERLEPPPRPPNSNNKVLYFLI